ncbi:MAG TPA: hypothetical protein VMV29_17120 [Ktedonobacterales bacterium]|nr:hypothetical protein [Ktedonobacterales bacterium]
MDSMSAETVFVPPHRPLRLTQTRYRLLPGLLLLGVFVILGLALGPYADVAAVSGLRSARSVEQAIRGALAFPNPTPVGATALAQPARPLHAPLTADADSSQSPATFPTRQRRASSHSSHARHHARKGPLPPSSPGAHGDSDSAQGHEKLNNPHHNDKQAQGSPGKAPEQHGHNH